MADQLLKTLLSSKRVFWQEKNGLPDSKIQELWVHHVAYLTAELGANPAGIGHLSIPKKRALPSTNPLGGARPSKRPNAVGCLLLDF
jgi:hypothetical protein